ncbi:MAG: pyruvate formate lyase family protein [Chloroflexota bacterium]|nr:pyruvate formate lyase family protein [Chloroflexota bacterium]
MSEQTTKEETKEAWWWEAEKTRSPKLDYLRKAVWSKGTTGGEYLPGIKADLNKVYWYTKVFKETDGLPWVERRSRALEVLCNNIPVFIVDHQCLLGYGGSKPNELLMFPEASYIINEEIYYDQTKLVPDEEKEWVRPCLDYWKDKSYQSQCERYMSDEERFGPGFVSFDASCSPVFDYSFVMEHGLNNIISMIDDKLDSTEDILCSGPSTPNTLHLHEKMDEWRAMKRSSQAVIDYSRRHGRLAKIIAENFETDPQRKAELLKISEISYKVPAEPAEHLQEALQCERYVSYPARFFERLGPAGSERIDQLYWPYYKKDVLDEKTLTRQDAVELFAQNNLKHYECTGGPVPRFFRAAFQGAPVHLPTLTIGGINENGTDACNELTEIVLEASRLTRVGEPSYMFRYHPGASPSALRSAYETIRQGMGFPSFQHEGISIDTLIHNFGATLEEARSYANVVCMSPGVTKGRGGQGVRYASNSVISHKCLELAFFNGFDRNVLRMQFGIPTGDATKFETFDALFEAFRLQMRYALEIACRVRNKQRYMEAKYLQAPFGSSLFKRCIDSGIDMVDARSEPLGNPWCSGVVHVDTSDSLYAVKKLVFDEKKYTMAELTEALEANWIGFAEMRQEFLNAPKFGNDIAEVDDMAARVYKMVSEEIGRNIEWGGARWMALPESASAWSAAGPMIGALPNGRRLGDCLYDGGISPGAGFDKKGPTAVLRSVSKVDARKMKQILLNQRLSPSQLAGEKGFQLWLNYMKTWYDLGVPHVQFNMVDNETLRSAQREPEKYQELIVRVAGYSAHFVELNALTQEGIIERTVQEI